MRKKTKVWLITAASLVLVGCGLFAGVMATLQWDFMELETVKYETNTYAIREVFEGISINTDTADLVFMPSDDGICKVVCHEEENAKHSVIVKDGTLTIDLLDERSFAYIGLNFDTPKITVYLPETEYASLLIKAITGNVCVKNLSFGTLDITVSTGKTDLTDLACKSLRSSGHTGDVYLNHVIAAEKLSIERSTGSVRFDDADATEIFVRTGTGDVTGSLLTDKVFLVQTGIGDVDVPLTADGGRCEIITGTGDVTISTKRIAE